MLEHRDGYSPHHHLYSALCKQNRINPYGRAILEHVYDNCDDRSGMMFTSSTRLADDIGTRARNVKNVLTRLKRAGLLMYGEHSNTTQLYYLPLKILILGELSRRAIIITRPWAQSLEIARHIKIAKTGAELYGKLCETGPAWADNPRVFNVFARNLGLRCRAAEILAPEKLSQAATAPSRELAPPAAAELPEDRAEREETNIRGLGLISDKLIGGADRELSIANL